LKSTFLDFPLIAIPEGAPAAWPSDSPGEREWLILYREDGEGVNLRLFLEKILRALSLDVERMALLVPLAPGESAPLSPLWRRVRPRRVVLFGIAPSELGLRFSPPPLYKPLCCGGVSYLLADPIALLYQERQRGEKQRSALLWDALRTLSSEK
jgi:hypothetical protein